MKKPRNLSNLKIFDLLTQADLEQIEQMAIMTNTWPKNSLIQTPESKSDGLFFVLEGMIRLSKSNTAGKQYTVGILGPGSIYGEISSLSFGTNGNYMETIEETHICTIHKAQFEQFLNTHPEFSWKLLEELSNRLLDRDEVLEKLALSDLRGKVLFFLTKLSKKFGVEENGYQKIDLPLTHQELANMIGATRESVSLVLQELSNDGVIITGRKKIIVKEDMARELMETYQ
ncbi:Crp/Fnr family transcriptional regulator [Paenibacillus oryzisoli]|uniref:Crp/Fnr family transcriptional regulator n=1 Tax=Paenibacillus oryzisoli TaxID=1850517 RepID=A0A198AKH2_9BACL|nr:Crp/Fnr family transcriptional regulator [Paenibacillus oryzisoli]OAS21541.1 hypothetical protein A8708_16535 [Paenibacillus oryzisoli]